MEDLKHKHRLFALYPSPRNRVVLDHIVSFRIVRFVQIVPKLESDYLATLVSNWAYWIPAQLVNFRFVAPAYQVSLFSSS